MTDVRRYRLTFGRQPEPIKRQRIVVRWVVASFCVIGLIAIVRGVQGAESTRRHEMVLLLPPEPDRRNVFVLSAAFQDRESCQQAKRRLVVMVRGATVQCLPVNPIRVK